MKEKRNLEKKTNSTVKKEEIKKLIKERRYYWIKRSKSVWKGLLKYTQIKKK
jgi:hypothetical protein